jgi:hypothetical protein
VVGAEAGAPGLVLERVGLEADVGVFHPACSLAAGGAGGSVEEARGEARRSWFVVNFTLGGRPKAVESARLISRPTNVVGPLPTLSRRQ